MPLLVDAVLAIGIGLFIGLEREHSDVVSRGDAKLDPLPEPLLGVRTFALLALFGWVSAFLRDRHPWLPVGALMAAGAIVTIAAVRRPEVGRGLTTEVAALTTFVLGMLVHSQRGLAVALALGTTLLLISKPWFRTFVPRIMRVDLTSTLQLLIVLAIVLPVLPAQTIDPWHSLSPRRLGLFVALIAAVEYLGYVLHRLLGAQRSAGVTGLVGGLVSSTAVVVAMARAARRTPSMVRPGQLAILLSSTVMLARVFVVSALISVPVATALAPPLGAMALCKLAGALWKWRQVRQGDRQTATSGDLNLTNPFSLLPALQWGALLAVVLLGSAMARDAFGTSGFIITAAISGLVDVDAINLAASRLASGGELDVNVAALAITVAVVSNTIAKSLIAWVSGGRRLGAGVASVFGVAMACAIVVALARVVIP